MGIPRTISLLMLTIEQLGVRNESYRRALKKIELYMVAREDYLVEAHKRVQVGPCTEEGVRLLLNAKDIDIHYHWHKVIWDHKTICQSALHSAIMFKLGWVAHTLLQKGAKPDCTNHRFDDLPLFYACYQRMSATAVALIAKGADIHENLCRSRGMTPLFLACQQDLPKVVEALHKMRIQQQNQLLKGFSFGRINEQFETRGCVLM